MILIPSDAAKFEVLGSTVDFLTWQVDGIQYFCFDSSMCEPPEPMVNAMVGFRLLTSQNIKLVMINHKSPKGLFEKIGDKYVYNVVDLPDGKVQVIFELRD